MIERFRPQVLAHEVEAKRMAGVTGHLGDGDVVTTGGLEITALFTPGHSPGHLSFLIGDLCFTADVLFKDTVGGTMRDSYESLHHSIMDVLMKLPPETRVLPGHTDPTTIGAEWEAKSVHPHLAGGGRAGRRAMHGGRAAGDAAALRRRLRRRPQGLGALGGRLPGHRPGQPGGTNLTTPVGRERICT